MNSIAPTQLIDQLSSKNSVARMVAANWFLPTLLLTVLTKLYLKTLGKLESLTLPAAVSNNCFVHVLVIRLWAPLLCIVLLNGCAAPLAAIGSSAGSTVTATAAAYPVTTASAATSVATGKSPLEHAVSAATKKECNFFNVVDSKPICIDKAFPPITDKSELYLGPADTTSSANSQ